MKRKALSLVVLLALMLLLPACAPGANPLQNVPSPGGNVADFWLGLWQGFIAPVTFIISIFRSDVNFYEVHNDGIPYNLGFVLGAGILFGIFNSGAYGARRRS